MNYFKAVFYRIQKKKIFIIHLALIILYTIFGNYVYKVNNYLPNDLYNHFGEEYLLIFLVIGFSFLIALYSEDLNHHLYYEYKKDSMFITYLVTWLGYLILMIIITFISSYIISIIWHFKVNLSFDIIINIIKIMPLLIIYNLILLLCLLTTKKASHSLMLTFFLYTFISYSENVLLNNKVLKYLFIYNLNFNHLYLKWYYAFPMFIGVFVIFLIIIRYILQKMS